MDTLTAIHARRSIRKYDVRKVEGHLLQTLIKAAMSAPSAGNEQPWHFLIITERSKLDAFPSFHPYSGPARGASAAIMVCGDLSLEKYRDCWVQDCAAAVQNILLAATALGLGAVWLGLHPDPERVRGAQNLFDLPDQIVPLALIPVGYPAEHKGIADRFNAERVHYEKW